MKFCYLDESGMGTEPYAVMAGVVVDAQRMALTKAEFSDLLVNLSELIGKPVLELHTSEFYPGNGVWRGLGGDQRVEVIDRIFEWLAARKHHVIWSAVDKDLFDRSFSNEPQSEHVGSYWRLMALHLTLALQKKMQSVSRPKGNTVLVFDNREVDKRHFTDLIVCPPDWTESYYGRKKKYQQLDQIVDVPHFVDSKDVGLVQFADFICFFLRKYAEIAEGARVESYEGEADKLRAWVEKIAGRSLGRQFTYPSRGRCEAAELFYRYAPGSIRDI